MRHVVSRPLEPGSSHLPIPPAEGMGRLLGSDPHCSHKLASWDLGSPPSAGGQSPGRPFGHPGTGSGACLWLGSLAQPLCVLVRPQQFLPGMARLPQTGCCRGLRVWAGARHPALALAVPVPSRAVWWVGGLGGTAGHVNSTHAAPSSLWGGCPTGRVILSGIWSVCVG